MISDKKIFRSGLYADYLNLETKDEDVLYFCTDTKQIFKGTIDVTQEYQQVYNKPDDPAVGILYASSENGTVETYNGASWVEVFAPIVGTDTVYSVPLPAGETSVNLPMPNEGDVVDIYTDNSAQYTSIEVNDATGTRSANNTESLTVNFTQQEISDIVHMRTYHNDQYTASILASLCIDGIRITHPADNTVFIKDEVFDIAGLQVAAIRGSEEIDITNSITTIPAVGTKLKNNGTVTVRIVYGMLETSYNINIISSIDEIEITTLPDKTIYKTGESLDLTGIVVTGYAHNKTESANITNRCTFNPANGTKFTNEDVYTVAVNYKKLRSSFDVEVMSNIPAIYNTVKNANAVTEAQWVEFCEAGCIKLARDNDDTASFIGKNITLSNTVESTYTSWKIADFNHDNSGDTCDLILNNCIYNNHSFSEYDYEKCTHRRWLINTYLPGFSANVQNKLQTMSISSNGTILNDKIALLSFTEINGSTGTTDTTHHIVEGTRYPIFTDNASRIRTGKLNWWTRSRYQYSYPWSVGSSGSLGRYFKGDEYGLGIVPVIRFA